MDEKKWLDDLIDLVVAEQATRDQAAEQYEAREKGIRAIVAKGLLPADDPVVIEVIKALAIIRAATQIAQNAGAELRQYAEEQQK